MKIILSIVTVLRVASAIPSLLPAQVQAAPRAVPESEVRFRHEPTGLSLVRPYVRGKTPVVFVHGLWASPLCSPDDRVPRDRSRDRWRLPFWTFGYSTGNPILFL